MKKRPTTTEMVSNNTDHLIRPTASFSADIPLQWNELYLEVERFTRGYVAPVSARAHAYINLAAYESALPGMVDTYRSFNGYYQDLELPDASLIGSIHYPTAVNAAYENAMRLFFSYCSCCTTF
ncbi:MAG: hypothetical protein HC912_01100 [Saprospiraceae bacterium]|nr:hypothetical protein [Saprospiraceae bacterium]